jgi:hypothetical protein
MGRKMQAIGDLRTARSDSGPDRRATVPIKRK